MSSSETLDAPDRCPECGSGDVEWGEDATTGGLWCDDCDDYVWFERTVSGDVGRGVNDAE